ncbi:MAG: Gfo/Idh/MocA family oxidoreductase [Victivallaceae bacterium]|nr:Gfo/Idh/MocA family oxidoreductase [Victivallaceae bacterium]
MGKEIKIALIGAGQRPTVLNQLFEQSGPEVQIASVYEPDAKLAAEVATRWPKNAAGVKIAASYEEAIATEGVTWVAIFSPNCNHKEHILAAFKAGKNVFSEKPLATTIEDCQAIYEAHKKTSVIFATGFVLRYAKIYEKAKEILDSGILGRIRAINADENIPPDHGGYIMRNWRRLSKFAGPHILEKCCHDLDLINWFCGSLPSKVASFGCRDFFVPANDGLMQKYGRETFCRWEDPHAEQSPFTSDKDLMDNQTSIAQYRNGILVTFQCTMNNLLPERRMYFTCSEGSLCLEIYEGRLTWRKMGDPCTHEIRFTGDGHAGGDFYIMQSLLETMRGKAEPRCSGNEGLQSAVFALGLDKAAATGKVVDMEEIWHRLGR